MKKHTQCKATSIFGGSLRAPALILLVPWIKTYDFRGSWSFDTIMLKMTSISHVTPQFWVSHLSSLHIFPENRGRAEIFQTFHLNGLPERLLTASSPHIPGHSVSPAANRRPGHRVVLREVTPPAGPGRRVAIRWSLPRIWACLGISFCCVMPQQSRRGNFVKTPKCAPLWILKTKPLLVDLARTPFLLVKQLSS